MLFCGVVALLGPAAGQPPPRGGPFGPPPGFRPPPRDSGFLLIDLTLTRRDHDRAHDALAAYDDAVRKATAEARKELLAKMKDILPESEMKKFQDELAAVPLIAPPLPGPRGVPEDDLVTRLLAFDKNGDGRVTADELPERMRGLIEQGDKNKDGALDVEEIRQLAAERARPVGPPGRGGRGPGLPPPGRGGRGG
jgi:hypothetical protein